MTEPIFVFDEHNFRSCQGSFRGAKNQEYYLGDYSIEAGSVVHVRADRKMVGPCSIICLRSTTRLLFRRTWSHIREDPTDVTVFWFVKRGRVSVTHPSERTIANAGDFLITRSTAPFVMECEVDDSGKHELLHVIVPSHLVSRFMGRESQGGFCIPAVGTPFALAQHILTDVFEDAGEYTQASAQVLVDSALCLLIDVIKSRVPRRPARQTLADQRLKEILRYMEVHLSDPKLSITSAAQGCGISVRYASLLFQLRGTSFSKLLGQKRLETAGRWMLESKPREVSIAEIAYRVGFKSVPHFSRRFKQYYALSPSAYRAAVPHVRAEESTPAIAGPFSLQ